MLVTLGSNTAIGANASATFTYSPNSIQKVFLLLKDADWDDCNITVQVGSTTIVNGISAFGLSGVTALSCNNGAWSVTGTEGFISLDLGSHVCTQNDNLYVTIQAGSGAISAVDVSALVDAPGANFPVRYTEYSDSTFTSENNLMAVCYESDKSVIDTDTNNCEIRTSISSSAPTFASSASWFYDETLTGGTNQYFGILNRHGVPLRTTYNYVSNEVDRIITVEQMGTSLSQRRQAKRSGQIAMSQAGK